MRARSTAAAAVFLTLADRRVNVLYQRCQRRPKLESYIYIITTIAIPHDLLLLFRTPHPSLQN